MSISPNAPNTLMISSYYIYIPGMCMLEDGIQSYKLNNTTQHMYN